MAEGIWVISAWLVMLFATNRPAFDAQVAAGAQIQSCVTWDAEGRAVAGTCSTPAPSIDLGAGR